MPRDFGKSAQTESGGDTRRDAIMAAVDEVVASEAFGRTERPARFLRHLVETTLRGESHLLKESVLGTDVFERPPSWDPRLDPIVRQEAARLRKRLAKYYETSGATDSVRIELPVGTYVPTFQLDAGSSSPTKSRRTGWYIAVIAAAACMAILITWLMISSHREVSPSIAVLPFTNLVTDSADQYFSDGLTDEITDSLARLQNLRVIARSSAFQFKGKTVDVREVGRQLNVTHVVEGNVERSGDRVKIIVHLERASDASVVWSNTYERRASDLFSVQSELAGGIASGLKLSVRPSFTRRIPEPAAHDLVMKGRYGVQQRTTESLAEAESDFRRAIDLDPQYAGAYAGLGDALYNKASATGMYIRADADREGAEQAFRKALELDPDLQPARAALARMTMQYEWDWGAAERELKRALAGPANADPEYAYAMFLIFRGRFAEADEHIRRYQELDPFSTSTMLNMATIENLEGHFAEARETARRVIATYPKIVQAQQLIGFTYIEEGRPSLALADLEPMRNNIPFARFREAMARARAGQKAQALELIRPFEDKYPSPGASMQGFALVYAFLGDEGNTLKWLERSADRREWAALNIAIHPVYAPMRNSSRFRALEQRMGLL